MIWLNHVTVAAPRNATTDHTVNPASGTVIAGSAFTATAGRLLVVIAEASVTSTTPAGWTLPAGGSAINNTGLYVWYRTAAGGDTFTTTHNAADYPTVFDIYEFTAGSTFVGAAAAINVTASPGGAGPTLSGLTGTNLIYGAAGQTHTGAGAISWTWASGVEVVDTYLEKNGLTDGYVYGAAYLEDSVLTSASIAATSTDAGVVTERLIFAVNVAVDPTGNIAAPAATGSGLARVPVVTVAGAGNVTAVRAQGAGLALTATVSGSGVGAVAAVRAQGSGLAQAPGVSGAVAVSGGGPASGTGQAGVPAVTGGSAGSATATAPAATGSGLARVPVVVGLVSSPGNVTAVRAQGSGVARVPGVSFVASLPANISLGRVTARFGTAQVLAGDADGIADFYPVTDATVTFTSTAPVLLDESASPAPVVILPKPIVCSLDANGYLVDEAGHRWVDLIATDDTDVRPTTRKWRVAFSGSLVGITAFDMVVPSNGNVDLTTVIPI